jgi:hypothetical protein
VKRILHLIPTSSCNILELCWQNCMSIGSPSRTGDPLSLHVDGAAAVAACRRFGTPRRARQRGRSRPRWARVRAAGAKGVGGSQSRGRSSGRSSNSRSGTLYSPIGGASFLAFFHFVHSRHLHSPFALAFSILPTPLLVDSFSPSPHWPRCRIVSIIPHLPPLCIVIVIAQIK